MHLQHIIAPAKNDPAERIARDTCLVFWRNGGTAQLVDTCQGIPGAARLTTVRPSARKRASRQCECPLVQPRTSLVATFEIACICLVQLKVDRRRCAGYRKSAQQFLL